jgi:uncharacterized protein (TIGR02271 family)
MNQTLVGYFDTRMQAQDAIDRLAAAGFPAGSASLSNESVSDASTPTSDLAVRTEANNDSGVLGGIRNFFGDVFGDSHEHMSQYEEGVQRGGCVVKVSVTSDDQLERATDILENAGAADIEERASQWSQSAATGATTSAAYAAPAAALSSDQSAAIPIVEESLQVGKKTVDRGGVRVYTRTVETPVSESVSLREEHAVVERRPVDRPLTAAEQDGFQERSIEVREMAEKAVVGKTARVVEEVVVGKQASEHTETISDSVRHTEVEVERVEGGATTTSASGSTAAYRSDYDSRYASLGGSYDDYEPAYQYGHSAASDQSYAGRGWDDVEPTLRNDWSTKNPGSSWEKVKDGVKHAWHTAKG